MGTEPKRILVIQTAFLGDVVLTTPLLQALRDRFPAAYLAVLVIPGTREILSGHSGLDEVLVYDKKGRDRGLRGIRLIVRLLDEKRFDCCLLPHRSFRSALLAFAAGIPMRIGFVQSLGCLLYSRRVWRDPSRHEVCRNLQLLGPLTPDRSLDRAVPTEKLWVSSDTEDPEWASRYLAEHGIHPNDRVIAIAPGSVWATKRWAPDGFAAVIDGLIVQNKRKVVLLGSHDDRPVVDEILKRCREKPVDLSGKTTLRQFAAVLKRCELLITNDNGAMHVGVAQNIPVVAIFGSTTLSLGYGPFTDRAEVVERSLGCRPCGKHGYSECPLGHFNCMKLITPEQVMTAVERMIQAPPQGL
ncbi:MAG: lipopolysaccharide heptosyltransferase II [Nitrospirae bacterium]|nr:lipopolysaccharide heptosyltransferase II [Nitrospirota bacterium]